MTPAEADAYLRSLDDTEREPRSLSVCGGNLERLRSVLERLGDPDRALTCVHIAGTKGKGSTAAMTARILQAAGCSVGLYTSPHLWDVRERIRILPPGRSSSPGRLGDLFPDCLTPEEFAAILDDVRLASAPDPGGLSVFETLTVAALRAFARHGVDVAVLETGMGGRWDATNVVSAAVCGITAVSLDHTRFLGGTVAAIAAEKAAIVKEGGQRVVSAVRSGPAGGVIRDRCRSVGASLERVGREIVLEGGEEAFSLRTPRRIYRLRPGLVGAHQQENAAVALGLVEALMERGFSVPPEAVEEGVRDVFWPGRFERLGGPRPVVLDGAHNPASARALVRTLKRSYPGRRIVMIAGFGRDKDIVGICGILAEAVSQFCFTKSRHPRAADLRGTEIEEVCRGRPVRYTDSVEEAVETTRTLWREGDVLVVAGSLFVVAEARVRLVEVEERERG